MPITQSINKSPTIPYDYNKDYSDEYVQSLFYLWYNKGKPSAPKLYDMIEPDPLTGKMPTVGTLNTWLSTDSYPFKLRAAELDQEVADALKSGAIGEKIEMHKRHADMGQELAQLGIDFLKEYGIDDPKTAVRAIVAGTDLEARSRGVDKVLETVSKMSDDELDKMLRATLKSVKAIDDGIDKFIEYSVLDDDKDA